MTDPRDTMNRAALKEADAAYAKCRDLGKPRKWALAAAIQAYEAAVSGGRIADFTPRHAEPHPGMSGYLSTSDMREAAE